MSVSGPRQSFDLLIGLLFICSAFNNTLSVEVVGNNAPILELLLYDMFKTKREINHFITKLYTLYTSLNIKQIKYQKFVWIIFNAICGYQLTSNITFRVTKDVTFETINQE